MIGFGDFMKNNSSQIAAVGEQLGNVASLATNIFGNSDIEKDKIGNIMSTDINGRPVYTTNAYQQSIDGMKDKAKGEQGASTLSGAVSGASIGTAIAPGIGTAIGAGVGAIGGLIGGSRRKKQLLNEVRNRKDLMKESIGSFNKANKNYFEDDSAKMNQSFLMSQRARRLG